MSRGSTLRTLAAACALGLLAGCASETTPEGYYAASREIRLGLKTPAGRVYGEIVRRKTRNRLERIARRCSVRSLDQRPVRLLYRLDAAGRPVESILYPETGLGQCIREALGNLEEFELPPPPRADFWISLSVPLETHQPGAPGR